MSEPSLVTQIAIRSRLIADPAVITLVPAARIFDRNTRPEDMPCIIVGDGMTALEPITLTRSHVRIFADIHVWTDEAGLENVKTIAGAVQAALRDRLTIPGFGVIDWRVNGTRFLRDPGNAGHAVIACEALVKEKAHA